MTSEVARDRLEFLYWLGLAEVVVRDDLYVAYRDSCMALTRLAPATIDSAEKEMLYYRNMRVKRAK